MLSFFRLPAMLLLPARQRCFAILPANGCFQCRAVLGCSTRGRRAVIQTLHISVESCRSMRIGRGVLRPHQTLLTRCQPPLPQ